MENYKNIVKDMAALKPAYMSVTYGATGGTSDYTVKLAEEVRNNNIPALAHLTCASSTREKVASVIEELKAAKYREYPLHSVAIFLQMQIFRCRISTSTQVN